MSRVGKQAAMERFGATLTNVRWSWDATMSDGSIIFIGWKDRVIHTPNGTMEYLLARDLDPDGKRPGARERIRHITRLLDTDAVGYLVLATAKDPTADSREIAHVAHELYSIRIERRGSTVVGVGVGLNSDPGRQTQAVEESQAVKLLGDDPEVAETERAELIRARRGQGLFRTRVENIEEGCRLTGVRDRAHLRAGHIKPWRMSTNAERLDGHNGLLLAPHIDHLFDRGFISFSDDGHVLVSGKLDPTVLQAWGVDRDASVGTFTNKQREYLTFHRAEIFRS